MTHLRRQRYLHLCSLSLLTLALLAPAASATAATHAPKSLHIHGLKHSSHQLDSSLHSRLPSLASLPASVDLRAWAPPVGEQTNNGCAAWAVAYSLRGWYARRQGNYPTGPDTNGGFAPMFFYSQLDDGHDSGSTIWDNLRLLNQEGVPPRRVYAQGDGTTHPGPTTGERAAALRYRMPMAQQVVDGPVDDDSSRQAIEQALAGQSPVVLGIDTNDNFDNADTTTPLVGTSTKANTGYHAIVAFAYDARGVWIENQWGTDWGVNGWVELSWDFVKSQVEEGYTLPPAAARKA